MSDFAIRISKLTKDYEVYNRPIDLALEVLTRRPRHAVFRALDNISFEVRRGEVLGIIGPNGAGKSTLLKILCGVLDASDGSVEVSGRITAILELGLGFNPEYSGRENIFLSGLLYGMSKAEVNSKMDEIVTFSGLSEVIERPVKTYSSGMHGRLAFSIATAVDPDILIVDEALATGDAAFVQKCLRRIRELCSGGRTAILVSHGSGLLAQLCQRVVWMERGQVRQIGPAIQVVQAYDLAAHQSADSASWIEAIDDSLAGQPSDSLPPAQPLPTAPGSSPEDAMVAFARAGLVPPSAGPSASESLSAQGGEPTFAGSPPSPLAGHDQKSGRQVFRRGPVFIERVELLSGEGHRTPRLTLLEPFALHVHYRVEGPPPVATLGIALAVNNKHDLMPVAQFMTQNIRPFETRESYAQAPDRFKAARRGVMILSFAHVTFRKGEYLLSIGLVPNEPASWIFYEYRHLYYEFSVDDAGMDVGAPILLTPVLSHSIVESEGPG